MKCVLNLISQLINFIIIKLSHSLYIIMKTNIKYYYSNLIEIYYMKATSFIYYSTLNHLLKNLFLYSTYIILDIYISKYILILNLCLKTFFVFSKDQYILKERNL
jgi:hypothetical protein